jgi:hypothetical protein
MELDSASPARCSIAVAHQGTKVTCERVGTKVPLSDDPSDRAAAEPGQLQGLGEGTGAQLGDVA